MTQRSDIVGGVQTSATPPWQDGVIRPAAILVSVTALVAAALGFIRNPGSFSVRSDVAVVLLVVLGVAAWRRASWRHLTMLMVIVLTYGGITYPASMGLRFSPMLLSALAVTIAASLLGRRVALVVLAAAVASLLVTGYGVSRGWFVIIESSSETNFPSWIRASVIFAGVTAALAGVVSAVVRSLESSLATTRRSLEQLRTSEERLAFALRSADDALWDFDARNDAVWYSPHWKPLLGYELDALPRDASGWLAHVHPDDVERTRVAMSNAAAGAEHVYEVECRLRRRDGSFVPVLVRAYVQRDAHGTVVRASGTCSDLTERERVAHERTQFERKLQETQKLESLGVLAGGIAHDFNNLLTSVLGNASLAAMQVPPESDLHDYLSEIQHAANRAAELCRQMLAYSGRGRFVVTAVALDALVDETIPLLQFSIGKNATLEVQHAAVLPPVEVDATQVRQVIMNLVINASEALEDADGTITVRTDRMHLERDDANQLRLATELPPGDYVCLEVSDTGSGMTPETRARIFDPFFTTKLTGRGLGLAAVLGIVRGHRGALSVQSELGKGSTFTLLFPAAAGDAAPLEPEIAPSDWRGEGTVLVVDDEDVVRRAACVMLEALGFRTLEASNGLEAVEIYSRESSRLTLVVLDLTMPKMDGERALAELRRLRADVRVLLVSGFNQPDALLDSSSTATVSFLQKPFSLPTLREAVQRVLA